MKNQFWRIVLFLIALAGGTAIGLTYGWVINPVLPENTEISSLRIDFKTDFALMTAELYHAQPDPTQATNLLNKLHTPPSISMMHEFISYAEANKYAQGDITLLQNLVSSLQFDTPGIE